MARYLEPLFAAADENCHRLLRWVLIATGAALVLGGAPLPVHPFWAYGFLLAWAASNVALHRRSPVPRGAGFYAALGLVDFAGSMFALLLNGQARSEFYAMYLLSVALAFLSRDPERALIGAGLVVSFYYFAVAGRSTGEPGLYLGVLATLVSALIGGRIAQLLHRQGDAAETDPRRRSGGEAEIQRVLIELNQEIATLDVPTLTQKLAELARAFLAADIADVRLVDGSTVRLLACSGGRASSGDAPLGSRSGRFVRLIETREPVVASDVARESAALKSGATRYPGVRGYLAVPFLSRQGEVIGALRALTYEPREFTPREVALLQQMASWAAILLENTRLIERLKSSNSELERTSREQLALRSLLADVFLLEVEPWLKKLTTEAAALFGADLAWLRLLDERGRIATRAAAGDEALVGRFQTGVENKLAGHARWILDHKEPLAVYDLAFDSRRRYAAAARAADLHGFLGAPILSRDREPLGLIAILTRRPREFAAREKHLIEQLASSAALAIENARLLGDLRDKTRELESANQRLETLLEEQAALREIVRQINLPDLDQLLTVLAERALKLLRVDHIQVRLVDDNGAIRTVALAGEGAERYRSQTRASGEGRSTWIMKNRRPLVIRDVGQDMYFGPGNLMQELGVKAYLGVPLISRQQQAIGVLIATSLGERSFTNDEIVLAEQLAAGAAVAIENAKLFQEVQEASKKIEEAFRTKTAFMNTMAHELRTPISVILGTHELFAQGIYGELTEEQKEAWERVRRNAQALLDLINEILNLVRLESKRVPLQIDRVEIAPLLLDLVSGLQPLAAKKGLELNLAAAGDIAIESDAAKIRTVLQNLVANAIKYTDRGRVDVRASLLDGPAGTGRVALSVSDTGIGLKQEDLKRIFEAFYMAEGVDRQKYPGTGLGLCIVQRLVELLGGSVEVESELGKGSTFTVTLPVNHPQARARPQEPGGRRHPPAGKPALNSEPSNSKNSVD
ncbi:MAG TPA: GAF domain-containing sensor histidine kinase [candidate division Zixibacteria bacterium]|nr:GAF domain-containing sensor histidine kinase [candidate division Zixibacteria bacterium]